MLNGDMMRKLVRDSLVAQGVVDAGEGFFLAGELTQKMTELYELKFPELLADRCIPRAAGLDAWAEMVKFQTLTEYGIAKMIHTWADDIPLADVAISEESGLVKKWALGYGWNFEELQQAARVGRPLEMLRAQATKKGIERARDDVAWFGAPEGNVPGFLTNPNIGRGVAAATGTGPSTLWSTKTGANIVLDFKTAFAAMEAATHGTEIPNTVIIASTCWAELAYKFIDTASTRTVLSFLQETYPGVEFIPVWNLNAIPAAKDPTLLGTGNSRNCMVLYRRDPMNLRQMVNLPFYQLPPFYNGTSYLIKCLARMGGTDVRYPLSVYKVEGI